MLLLEIQNEFVLRVMMYHLTWQMLRRVVEAMVFSLVRRGAFLDVTIWASSSLSLAKPISFHKSSIIHFTESLFSKFFYIMARSMIQDAGTQLQELVTRDEASVFNHTTLGDVQHALQAIEDEQARRRSLTNLRRIEPFLSWMRDYSSILDTFCQGFSPMAWVWVLLSCLEEFGIVRLWQLTYLRDRSN